MDRRKNRQTKNTRISARHNGNQDSTVDFDIQDNTVIHSISNISQFGDRLPSRAGNRFGNLNFIQTEINDVETRPLPLVDEDENGLIQVPSEEQKPTSFAAPVIRVPSVTPLAVDVSSEKTLESLNHVNSLPIRQSALGTMPLMSATVSILCLFFCDKMLDQNDKQDWLINAINFLFSLMLLVASFTSYQYIFSNYNFNTVPLLILDQLFNNNHRILAMI